MCVWNKLGVGLGCAGADNSNRYASNRKEKARGAGLTLFLQLAFIVSPLHMGLCRDVKQKAEYNPSENAKVMIDRMVFQI